MADYNPNYTHTPAYFLLGVKVVVVNQFNQILMLKRSSKVSSPHRWDFPGGGVDQGENPAESVVRECFEEAALAVNEVIPLTTTWLMEGSDEAVIIGYTAKTDTNTVILSWEHEDYKWIDQGAPIPTDLPELHKSIYAEYKKACLYSK